MVVNGALSKMLICSLADPDVLILWNATVSALHGLGGCGA